jgi:hypothetical protein
VKVYSNSGKQTAFEQKFGFLQSGQVLGKLRRGQPGDRLQQAHRHHYPDDRGRLQQLLVRRRQAVDAVRQDGEHRDRNAQAVDRDARPVGAPGAHQHSAFVERAHDLLDEKRIALGPFPQQILERREVGAVSRQRLDQSMRALYRQGVDANAGIIIFACPRVAVARPVIDQQLDARRRQAVDEQIQKRLSLAVDPM